MGEGGRWEERNRESEREREGKGERDRIVRELFPANYAAGFRTKVQIYFPSLLEKKISVL